LSHIGLLFVVDTDWIMD